MKYAYDYQNIHTRGWVRGEALNSVDQYSASAALESASKMWPSGTVLRLVEIADDGIETFSPTSVYGSRGPLPKDKKTS